MSQIMAVDVGGTFTDVVVADPESGAVTFAKAPTTPSSPSLGVMEAVRRSGCDLATADYFFHGTTVGLNSVLEHRGARVGLITTKGFRDVLEIGRGGWPMYQPHYDKPAPLVPRRLRLEVAERVSADGGVIEALDAAGAREAVAALLEAEVSAVAVCLINAYANPAHELRIGELLREMAPTLDVTLSHVVSQEYREFERTSTAIVDAMIKPVMSSYVKQLDESLRESGFAGQLLITRADGGVMTADEVPNRGVQTLMSGPASGAMGAVEVGKLIGADRMLAVDMGGTSFDAAVIADGEATRSARLPLEGVPLLMPAVEIATIGAGGGSIAWIDQGGGLNVGPQSAGADPGPICFGNGGTAPTFTDAALVTGLIDPGSYLGGAMQLDVDGAREGIRTTIAEPLGLDVIEAAAGIVELTEARMASLLHQLTVERGSDPREFTLLGYGGGGPLVATALADRLSMPRIVIPHSPATFSAWGMLTLDIVHDYARTAVSKLDRVDGEAIQRVYEELEEDGRSALTAEGVSADRQRVVREIDMRYQGQEHTLTIGLDDLSVENVREVLRERFGARHEALYGYRTEDPIDIVTYRVRSSGLLDSAVRPVAAAEQSADASGARTGSRQVVHRASGGAIEFAVYSRSALAPGNRLEGPAVIEEDTSTTTVLPGWVLEVDRFANLVIGRR